MPVVNVLGYTMVSFDFSYKEIYWKELTEIVQSEFGEKEIRNAATVQNIFKKCFSHLRARFEELIDKEKRASFYIFVHNFHENSIELYFKVLNGEKIPYDESDLAIIRRILKIIQEQGCGNELIGSKNFSSEIFALRLEFLKILEELLYVGYQAINFSEFIAKSQLFPTSIGFQVIKNKLTILTYKPYENLFQFIESEIPKHNEDVKLYNEAITHFRRVLKYEVGLDYDIIASFTKEFEEHREYNFGVFRMDDIINVILEKRNFNQDDLRLFFSGLTVSKNNKLNVEECILKNQDIRRYTYRPILQLQIDNTNYILLSANRWHESLSTLFTNALPFGVCPSEWLSFKPINNLVTYLKNTHDEILESPVINILVEKEFMYDYKVTSLYCSKTNKNQVGIVKKGIGEIDIMFLDTEFELIYVCECKHNRARFDVNNWQRDYSNFEASYENQLTNKVNWVMTNINIVEAHFSRKYKIDLNLESFKVRGCFIINAPTLYMFNGKFRAFTIRDIKNLLNREYVDTTLVVYDEDTKEETVIKFPYFKNAEKIEKS